MDRMPRTIDAVQMIILWAQWTLPLVSYNGGPWFHVRSAPRPITNPIVGPVWMWQITSAPLLCPARCD